jgi:hypothetical protein
LLAVCAKVMSAQQVDRYASPRALAAEVEHWLADEPVTAWREPFASARALVAPPSLGLSLASSVVLLAASNLLIRDAQHKTSQALGQVEQEQQRTAAALKDEESARVLATANEKRARFR